MILKFKKRLGGAPLFWYWGMSKDDNPFFLAMTIKDALDYVKKYANL